MMNTKLLRSLYISLRSVRYILPAGVIIFICCYFLYVPQIAFSLGTKEKQAFKLIHTLRSQKDFIKIETIEEKLIGMGPEIQQILIAALSEELAKEKVNREFTISIIRVIGEIHDPLAVPALLSATNIIDWIVRQEAVYALANIIDNNRANLDMLVTILKANDPFIEAKAKDAILKIESSKDVTDSLIAEINVNKDTAIRVIIVDILSSIKSNKAVGCLFTLLNDNDDKVRKEAVKALHKIEAIKKSVGKETLLTILDIIKDQITFIEIWDQTVEELYVPNLKDINFLIEALKIGVHAESNNLKVKVMDRINSIGEPALERINTALENTGEDNLFHYALLDVKTKLIKH